MKRMIQLTLLMASILFGSSAMAEQHNVMILKEGYFPNKLFYSNGDTIRFTNESDETVHLKISGASVWLKTNLSNNSTYTYSIPSTSSMSFLGAYRTSKGRHGYYTLEMYRATAPTSCASTSPYLATGVCN